MQRVKFYGSQVGGQGVTAYSYTGAPLSLLVRDVLSAISFFQFLPFIFWPFKFKSGQFCEMHPSGPNLFCMFLHLLLILMQVPFILSVPFWVFFPLWSVIIGVASFWTVNQGICYILNGSKLRFASQEKFAQPRPEHAHEQWVFMNGVAVGKHWLQSNVDRLALTFGRPVLGVHNKTNGILFDIVQCLIQRNFDYATSDIRDCYQIIKETIYDSKLTKVIFILHSQGAIEGGMIIDWLLQEVPQDLLAKLEVYTFGNAANHFNNPHLHLLTERADLTNPTSVSTTKTTTQVHYHDPIVNGVNAASEDRNHDRVTRATHQSSSSGRTLRYIEHYAHTSDFVARWGVLHFIYNFSTSLTAPAFMGRLFERLGEGHMLNQHYLDNMFPLKKSAEVDGGIGGSGFDGTDDGSEFMKSVVEWSPGGDEQKDMREGLEKSYFGAHGQPLDSREEEVLSEDMSPASSSFGRRSGGSGLTNGTGKDDEQEQEKEAKFRVEDLSRLWLYRNGLSPKTDDEDIGVQRMATI